MNHDHETFVLKKIAGFLGRYHRSSLKTCLAKKTDFERNENFCAASTRPPCVEKKCHGLGTQQQETTPETKMARRSEIISGETCYLLSIVARNVNII